MFDRWKFLIFSMILAGSQPGFAQQRMQEREQEFLDEKPLINDPLPEVTIYAADGSRFKTSSLRGHYTVLTFGCLTCPPSMWSIAGLEAVHRDYSPKGVQFYFIYKALAHPELAGNMVQPFTLDERLAHARQAGKQFGTKIPWIVDDMDNRMKRAMGDRPNSQFLVNPDGVIVRKRAWANAPQVRKDLEELVGPVEHITREEDLHLLLGNPIASTAKRGVVSRIPRPRLNPLVIEPQVQRNGLPFFAKLRAEASASLVQDGVGELYLGFHLDPLHNAHWNHLTKPLSFQIDREDGVQVDRWSATAEVVTVADDADPREFLLKVAAWPVSTPLRLTVTYFACVGTDACHMVRQEYIVHRKRDQDGGGARGEGAGFWKAEEFAQQLLRSDKDNDGKLTQSEVAGIIRPHFDKLDVDRDGFLVLDELMVVAEWLNHHHQPGAPSPTVTNNPKAK